MLLRSPCKKLKSYHTPLCQFSNGGKTKKTKSKKTKSGRIHQKFPLAPMGVLAPGSAHADPLLGPPSTLAEIVRHPCLQSGLRPSKRSKSAFSQFSGQNRVILGGRGGPRFFFL